MRKAKPNPKVAPKLIKKAAKIFKNSLKERTKQTKIRAKAARRATIRKKQLAELAKKQPNKVSIAVSGNGFEGVKRIDHLPLDQQIDTVFNPLHSITKTTTTDTVSQATFIVHPKKSPKG